MPLLLSSVWLTPAVSMDRWQARHIVRNRWGVANRLAEAAICVNTRVGR